MLRHAHGATRWMLSVFRTILCKLKTLFLLLSSLSGAFFWIRAAACKKWKLLSRGWSVLDSCRGGPVHCCRYKGLILHLRKQQLTSANYTLMRMHSGRARAHATCIRKFQISPVLMFINRSSRAVATCMILRITLLPRWMNSGIIRHRCSY